MVLLCRQFFDASMKQTRAQLISSLQEYRCMGIQQEHAVSSTCPGLLLEAVMLQVVITSYEMLQRLTCDACRTGIPQNAACPGRLVGIFNPHPHPSAGHFLLQGRQKPPSKICALVLGPRVRHQLC